MALYHPLFSQYKLLYVENHLGGICNICLDLIRDSIPQDFSIPFPPKGYFCVRKGISLVLMVYSAYGNLDCITKDSLISLCPFHRQTDICSPCMSITQKSFKYKWNVTPVILSCCQQRWTFPQHGRTQFLHLIKFMWSISQKAYILQITTGVHPWNKAGLPVSEDKACFTQESLLIMQNICVLFFITLER